MPSLDFKITLVSLTINRVLLIYVFTRKNICVSIEMIHSRILIEPCLMLLKVRELINQTELGIEIGLLEAILEFGNCEHLL